MRKSIIIFTSCLLVITLLFWYAADKKVQKSVQNSIQNAGQSGSLINSPLSIETMRGQSYPGSEITIEETIEPGANYKRYIASYQSDGFKIYGLLTVPNETPPKAGYPAIIFGHGYIPPEEYRTTEKYVAYVDNLARSGYVVYKIDYRGHGNSEGTPEGAYFSPAYTSDVLNAAASLKKLSYVNPNKLGLWGHSMAGMIMTRAMAVKPKEFKAAVLWGGVVGSYYDLSTDWWSKRRTPTFTPSNRELQANRPSRQLFTNMYGQPSSTSAFWRAISPTTYVDEINTPIQLDVGEADETVPPILSEKFYSFLKSEGKTVELYTYPGNDHNISQSFGEAMQHSLEFFNKYLK